MSRLKSWKEEEEKRRGNREKEREKINREHDKARVTADNIDGKSLSEILGISTKDEARKARNEHQISSEQFLALSRYFRKQKK